MFFICSAGVCAYLQQLLKKRAKRSPIGYLVRMAGKCIFGGFGSLMGPIASEDGA